jgi:hypothetical protein
VFAAGCLAAAACVALTARFHRDHQSDTLIPALCSLYGWTPFYWEQDRLGMVVPLLARPVTHPLANLLVQNGVTIFLGLAALGVLARFLYRDDTAAGVGAAAAAVFLLAFHPFYRFHVLNGAHPYLQPLGLALLGVMLAGGARGRWWPLGVLAGVGLTGVAYWWNVGIGVMVGPMVAARWAVARWLNPPPEPPGPGGWVRRQARKPANRELAAGVALTLLGSLLGQYAAVSSEYAVTNYTLAPRDQWADAWGRMFDGVRATFADYLWAARWTGGLGLVWFLVPATRRAAGRAWLCVGVVAAGLAAQLLVVGSTEWAKMNAYDLRYLLGGVAAVGVAAAGVLVGPPLTAIPGAARWWVTAALAAAVPAVAVSEFGRPSVASARAGLDAAAGSWTADVIEGNCTHVVGNYWCVWPAVFHANMTLADRGDPRVVWGVGHRSHPTRPHWQPAAEGRPRVGWLLAVYIVGAVPPNPPETAPTDTAAGCAREVFPALREAERRRTLWVYVRADRPGP